VAVVADARTVGDLVDGLGVTADLGEGVLVSDVVVLMECVHPDGTVSLLMAQSDRMSWIKKVGMLTAATAIENDGYRNMGDD
jgi:hypothetical protein